MVLDDVEKFEQLIYCGVRCILRESYSKFILTWNSIS